MARAVLVWAVLAMGGVLAAQDAPPSARLLEGWREALAPALPFPEARADGLPVSDAPDPEWAVRWPSPGETRIEELANPLNPDNRARALAAEREIQAAAMRAQSRAQGDDVRALREFERTGRVDPIREVPLRDDGVAGERYDAESQLTIELIVLDAALTAVVPGEVAPVVLPDAPTSIRALARATAQVYDEPGPDGEARYTPAQAWVILGEASARVAAGTDAPGFSLTVTPDAAAGPAVLVHVSGNQALVEQVVSRANWAALAAALGG